MSNYPVPTISDFQQRASGRLTSEYERAQKLIDILEAIGSQFQVAEDAVQTTITAIWIDDASGVQLDRLGHLVGAFRDGRSDADYRAAIKAQIVINRGGGNAENYFRFLRTLREPRFMIYVGLYPTMFELYVGMRLSDRELDKINELRIAGAGSILIYALESDLKPFGFDRAVFTQSDGVFDDGSPILFDDGSQVSFQSIEAESETDRVIGFFGELDTPELVFDDGSNVQFDDGSVATVAGVAGAGLIEQSTDGYFSELRIV